MKFAVTLVTVDVYQAEPISNIIINSKMTKEINVPLQYKESKKCYTGGILYPDVVPSEAFYSNVEFAVTCLNGVFMEKNKYLKTLTYITQTKQAIRNARLAQQSVILKMEKGLNRLRDELRTKNKPTDWRTKTKNIVVSHTSL